MGRAARRQALQRHPGAGLSYGVPVALEAGGTFQLDQPGDFLSCRVDPEIRYERSVYVRVTLKLAPPAPRAEAAASCTPEPLIIVICFAPAAAAVTVCWFSTAEALVNWTVRNWSSRTMPRPELGASSIHSADDPDEA